ncbi:hypothetical protein BRADI_5g07901v3 [Brachypodium distachyon]|uniref:Knottin scorpion toxin-like domain-containing protein n=1 Tax=Brachypodium distachyon TaxID=15368 RepID=I1IX29_BRADI|nr:hypothetical protein BRADI_5g07901v3 [Brachypodium distachyon]
MDLKARASSTMVSVLLILPLLLCFAGTAEAEICTAIAPKPFCESSHLSQSCTEYCLNNGYEIGLCQFLGGPDPDLYSCICQKNC